MAEYILTVGTGKTYADIAAAWAALPSTIALGDVYRIQLAAQTFSEAFIAGSKTVSGDIIIEPEAGAAWYETNDYSINALSDSVSGCAQIIGSQPFAGVWKFPVMGGTISVQGLAFRANGGWFALDFDGGGTVNIERCLLVSEAGAQGVLKLGGMNGTIKNNVLIKLSANTTHGAVEGIDTNGKTVWFDNNLIIAPTARAESWLVANYGDGIRFRNNAVFGFQAEPPSARFHADSGYNATDLSGHPGTNNLLSLSAASQYVSPSGTLDLRLKAGSVLIDGGMDSGVAIDFTGAARTLPYSIGPQEAIFSAADTTAPTLTSPTASATGATTASGSVSTNEANGTLYYLASANATELAATVKAGSSQAVTAINSQSVTVTGLTASTSYYLHFVHRDAAGNDSDVETSAQFTTAAANTSPSFTGPNIADISGTEAIALTPVDVSSLFFDSESGLTFSALGTWPAGVTVSSAGVISGTPTTAGTYSGLQVRATDAGALTADSNTFAVTVDAPAVAGINVTEPLKNNTGTVLASQSGVRVAVLQAADLVSVYEATGLTTNASGILATISDAAITTGQQYHVAIKLADGSVGITGPITAS